MTDHRSLFATDSSVSKVTAKQSQFQTKLRKDNRDKRMLQKRELSSFQCSENLPLHLQSSIDALPSLNIGWFKTFRDQLAIEDNFKHFSNILKTQTLDLINTVLHAHVKTELKLESIYILQNLSLVAPNYEAMFRPTAATLCQIVATQIGLDPSNLILLKDASLKCLMCFDTESLLSSFDWSILAELTKLKRGFLTQTVFQFASHFNYQSQSLLRQVTHNLAPALDFIQHVDPMVLIQESPNIVEQLSLIEDPRATQYISVMVQHPLNLEALYNPAFITRMLTGPSKESLFIVSNLLAANPIQPLLQTISVQLEYLLGFDFSSYLIKKEALVLLYYYSEATQTSMVTRLFIEQLSKQNDPQLVQVLLSYFMLMAQLTGTVEPSVITYCESLVATSYNKDVVGMAGAYLGMHQDELI